MQDPVLEKMQQLMNKYQVKTPLSGMSRWVPNHSELPVLSEIVQLGDAVPVAARNATHASEPPTSIPAKTDLSTLAIQSLVDQLCSTLTPLIEQQIQQFITLTLAEHLPHLQTSLQQQVREQVQHCVTQLTPKSDETQQSTD